MTDSPEHLDLTSHNFFEDKTQELLRLFPEIRTEGGKMDFDKLKLVLGETVDVGRERYGVELVGSSVFNRKASFAEYFAALQASVAA